MNWYYAQGGESRGPIPETVFAQLLAQGVIRPETLVWHEGMTNWLPYRDLQPTPPPAVDVPPAPNSSADPASNSSTSTLPQIVCQACNRGFPEDELVTLGGRWICAACKPTFLQQVCEGSVAWDGIHPGALLPKGLAHGQLSETEILDRDYDIPAVELISQSGRLTFQEPSTLLAGGVVAMLVIVILQMVPYVGFFLQAFIVGPIAGGLTVAYLRRLRGATMSIGDVFSGFGPRFWPLSLAYFIPWIISTAVYVPAIAIFLGGILGASVTTGAGGGGFNASSIGIIAVAGILYLAGILTGIYLTIRWIYTVSLVADRGYRFWPAMSLSGRMVSKHFWQHLWFFFLSGILTTVGVFFCCVGVFAVLPVIALAGTVLYERLFHGLRANGPSLYRP